MQKDSSKEYLGSNAKNFSILAFEEPEAHLHPNMQYKLLKFLGENIKNEVRQIFITTHSPNITSKIKLDSLIVLTKLNNEIKISYPGKVFSSSEEDVNSKKYIERFLDVTKADMFFAKNLIFVEGLAEQLLLPIFAEKLGISLEDNHISIVNVNGRYFEHFIKLFNTDTSKFAIPKKVVCITDQDPIKKMKPEGNWEKCYSFEINLEKESYEYEVTSNKTLENLKELNKDSFYIATQKEGSTFEYEMLLENYKSSFFITESVANKELLREMIKNVEKIKNKDDLLEEVNKFNKSKLRDLQIKYIENSEEDIQQKAKHIIASRYLASIGKGEVAQELATVLSNDMEFNVPSYIKEALEWLCKK